MRRLQRSRVALVGDGNAVEPHVREVSMWATMHDDPSTELHNAIERMRAARCGPAFDLDDVRAVLGDALHCIARTTRAPAATNTASALSNAVSCLMAQGTDMAQVRGIVAMLASRSTSAQVREVKELVRLLREGLTEQVPVICAGVWQPDLQGEVQVQMWARID